MVHCATKAQAEEVLAAIVERMSQVGLELHPDKTRIVHCKVPSTLSHEHERFDFLGYTFRARRAKTKRGTFFVTFLPAVSNDAKKQMGREICRWRINRRSDKALKDQAAMGYPIVAGWWRPGPLLAVAQASSSLVAVQPSSPATADVLERAGGRLPPASRPTCWVKPSRKISSAERELDKGGLPLVGLCRFSVWCRRGVSAHIGLVTRSSMISWALLDCGRGRTQCGRMHTT